MSVSRRRQSFMVTATTVYGVVLGTMAWLGYYKAMGVIAVIGGILLSRKWVFYPRGGGKSSGVD
jgi:hypothetical protein